MKGKDNKIGFLGSPLEVVFGTDLNGSGMSEGGGNDQFVICNMKKLRGSETLVLKSS